MINLSFCNRSEVFNFEVRVQAFRYINYNDEDFLFVKLDSCICKVDVKTKLKTYFNFNYFDSHLLEKSQLTNVQEKTEYTERSQNHAIYYMQIDFPFTGILQILSKTIIKKNKNHRYGRTEYVLKNIVLFTLNKDCKICAISSEKIFEALKFLKNHKNKEFQTSLYGQGSVKKMQLTSNHTLIILYGAQLIIFNLKKNKMRLLKTLHSILYTINTNHYYPRPKEFLQKVVWLPNRSQILTIDSKKTAFYINAHSHKKRLQVVFESERISEYQPPVFSGCKRQLVMRLYNKTIRVYSVQNDLRPIKSVYFGFKSDYFCLSDSFVFVGKWNQKILEMVSLPQIISRIKNHREFLFVDCLLRKRGIEFLEDDKSDYN